MCGRYNLIPDERAWADVGAILGEEILALLLAIRPRYNISPTQTVPIIVMDDDGKPRLIEARWGFIPVYWKKPIPPSLTTNVRSETAAIKPMWKHAWRRQRCLIPASGWYEWVRHEVAVVIVRRVHPAGPAVPSAVPYEVRRRGNEPSNSPRTMYPPSRDGYRDREGSMSLPASRRQGPRVDGMVSISKSPQVSSTNEETKDADRFPLRSVRASHSPLVMGTTIAGIRERPKPFGSWLWNMVSPYCSRKGRPAVRSVDGTAGMGGRKKRRPRGNSADTSCNIARRESGLTSSWSSFTRESAHWHNRVGR